MIREAALAAVTVFAAKKQIEHGREGDGVVWRKALMYAVACCAVLAWCARGEGRFARSVAIVFCAMYAVLSQNKSSGPTTKKHVQVDLPEGAP